MQLLAQDEEFVKMMAPDTWHKNPNKELPLVHWSRLQTQLKPFLSSKIQDGEELMYFFHREFEDTAKQLPNQQQEHEALIKANQKLIVKNQDKKFAETRWGKLYATLITEYELRYEEKQKEFALFLVDTKNLKEEWIDNCLVNMNNIGLDHSKHNRMYRAIAYQESFSYTSKELYKENPQRWAEPYTLSLNNLAGSYKNHNRLTEAIELEEEALEIVKELYKENPQRWAEDYTRSLNNLASSYKNQNRLDEAIELEEEALEIVKELYKENPQRWVGDYTRSLNNLATSYYKQNHLTEAIELYEEALKILKELYKENPQRWAEPYTGSLNNLASSYKNQNRLDEAIELEEEALEIVKELYKENPQRWAEDYTGSLNNLAMSYHNKSEKLKVIEIAKTLKEVCEYHEMKNSKFYENAITLLSMYEQSGRTEDFQKTEATFTDLLYLSKFVAQIQEKNEISIDNFIFAFGFIEFNEEVKQIFSQLVDLDVLGINENARQYIEQVKNTPEILYSEELKELVDPLKEIFGNSPIGTLR